MCDGCFFDGCLVEMVDFVVLEFLFVLFDCVWLDVIINMVVYMVVDCVEQEELFVGWINGEVVGVFGCWVVVYGVLVVYYFIDYVFDGFVIVFYFFDVLIVLLGVYGCSKLVGEIVLCESGVLYLIFCIVWVYVLYGYNFLCMMLWFVGECDMLNVVVDQVGVLISIDIIVVGIFVVLDIWLLVDVCVCVWMEGVYYLVVFGYMSWYGFVEVIFDDVVVVSLFVWVLRVNFISIEQFFMLVWWFVWLVLVNEGMVQYFGYILLVW